RTVHQLAEQGVVLLGGSSARPGALDRPRLDLAGSHFQEALRRGAGQREMSADAKVTGERSGVLATQPAVQLQRMLGGADQQSLRQVDLEAVARMDVVDGPLDGGAITLRRKVARDPSMARKRILRTEIVRIEKTAGVERTRRAGGTAQFVE